MTTYERLTAIRRDRGAGYFILLDPDKLNKELLPSVVRDATEAGVDAFLVGGSLLLRNDFDRQIQTIKEHTSAPVVIFPGSLMQVSSYADAILFLMLISGRNPEYLIGNQVFAFGRYQIIQDGPYIVRLDRRTGELRAFIIAESQSRSGPDVVFVEKGHYPGDEGIL